jgi:SAM-dependent methyltransferase
MCRLRPVSEESRPCLLCGHPTSIAEVLYSNYSHRDFHLRQCHTCLFIFVDDPRLDFDQLYDEAYYSGKGADRSINYTAELEQGAFWSRNLEWRGICKIVESLVEGNHRARWLDYGCGTGGLVRFASDVAWENVEGFDQGYAATQLQRKGIPHLEAADLATRHGFFDVVTAIEVVEHSVEPRAMLSEIRQLLKPGGALFMTTGNSTPYQGRMHRWRYVVPEVHVSYFRPENLAQALESTGFEPEYRGYMDGWDEIIAFKILKGLGWNRINPFIAKIPWAPISRIVDRRLQITRFPVGWAVP